MNISLDTGRHVQGGMTLVTALLMLTLIASMLSAAYLMSSGTLLSVSNTQYRDEAISAINKALEQIISSDFVTNPQAQGYNIDINNDGRSDYVVNFAVPTCLTAYQVTNNVAAPSSLTLGAQFNTATTNFYRSIWDLDATATDASGTGTTVRIHQAVHVLLTQSQYQANCS